jgi:hypothetical protein
MNILTFVMLTTLAFAQIFESHFEYVLNMRVLHFHRGTEAVCVAGDIVSENDRTHRRLPGATLSHQQNFALRHLAKKIPVRFLTQNKTEKLTAM